jgi:hypothetical protein
MKPSFCTLFILLLTSCVILKKQAATVTPKIVSINVNEIALTCNSPKCIVLKRYTHPDAEFPYLYTYYFFPEYNIFTIDCPRNMSKPLLGYYNSSIGDSLVYIEAATKGNEFKILNKSTKRSTDSIYLHFNISSLEGLPFNEQNPLNTTNFSPLTVSILKNRPDSCEFIVALKKEKNLSNVYLRPIHSKFNVDEEYNYYEIGGDICSIVRRRELFPLFMWSNTKDTLKITQITKDSFTITSKDNRLRPYTRTNLSSLTDAQKEKIYLLPTFIKILECSGNYPHK